MLGLKINLPRNLIRCTKQYSTRNIGIIAHIDAGKTTTTERILYYGGKTNRLGDVDTGDTVTDFLPAERARGITIQSAAITVDWKDSRINLIDTPGHADFTFEVLRSLRVLDGAVTILDAVAGVEAQTEKVWAQAAALSIPRIVFVNKMDRPGAGFSRAVKEVVTKLHARCVILNIPIFEESKFVGVVDLLSLNKIIWKGDGKNVEVSPANSAESVSGREALVETLSEFDEDVVTAFLEEGDVTRIPSDILSRAIRKATLNNQVVPVMCGASFRNIGVQPLLDAVCEYLPSPEERESTLEPVPESVTCALAFKVRNDPIRGTLVFVRVYSGTLKRGYTVLNTNTGEKERISTLVEMQANAQNDVQEIHKGNIGVIVGANNISTGDTLVAHPTKKAGINSLDQKSRELRLLPIPVPPPVFITRIEPESVADQRGMKAALDILLREDPSLRLSYDEEAGQWLLSGMGELHLQIAQNRLVEDLKAKIRAGTIMITYKETIARSTPKETVELFDNVGSVRATVSISPHDIENLACVGNDELPDNNTLDVKMRRHPVLTPADVHTKSKQGILPVLAKGGQLGALALMGLRFQVNVEVSPECTNALLVSSAVRQAASQALAGLKQSDFKVLEPIMQMSISAPQSDAGNILLDISGARNGQVESIGESVEGVNSAFKEIADDMWTPTDYTLHLSKVEEASRLVPVKIRAAAPLRKLVGYGSKLRSLTQGRGSFEIAFLAFQAVLPHDLDEVLEGPSHSS